jgi:aldehyde:ferredoxin oxidoreductase
VGHVFRDKKIKAIVVKYSNLSANSNGPAKPDLIRDAGRRILRRFWAGQQAKQYAHAGHHQPGGNNQTITDLLPTENFRYGRDPRAKSSAPITGVTQFDHTSHDSCWHGCSMVARIK